MSGQSQRLGPRATLNSKGRLYADRPGCPITHHNTVGSYRMGCRCPEAVEAKRVADKRRRQGRSVSRRRCSVGTSRRLQALLLAGHRAVDIAAELGTDCETVRDISRGERKWVTIATAAAVKELAHRWAHRPGTSRVTSNRALRAGYVSLAAWDDIDDPSCRPAVDAEPDPGYVDEVKIQRALSGNRVELTDAEALAALTARLDSGESITTACQRLRIGRHRADRLLATLPSTAEAVAA